VFSKLSWFFKQYWKRYLFAITALIIASAIGLVPPKLVGFIIDHIQMETLTHKILMTIILIYIALLIAHYTIGFLWDYTLFGGAVILERVIRSRLMSHKLKMTPTFFGKY